MNKLFLYSEFFFYSFLICVFTYMKEYIILNFVVDVDVVLRQDIIILCNIKLYFNNKVEWDLTAMKEIMKAKFLAEIKS